MHATLLIALTLLAQQNPEAIRTGETVLVHAFGDRGLSLADGRSGVPATLSPGTYYKLETCMQANDTEGLRQLVKADQLTLVPVGTRVLVRHVMDYHDIHGAEVRLLDGPDKDEDRVRVLPVQFLTRNPRLATVPKAKAAKPKRPIRKGAHPTPKPANPES